MIFTNEETSPISVEGRGVNEDTVTVNERSAWVLDGGTGLGDVNVTSRATDAKWYVDRFSAYLDDHIDDRERSIQTIVRGGIKHVAAEYADQCGERTVDTVDRPTATCAIVRLIESDDPMLELYVLSDSTAALWSSKNPTELVHDDRYHRFGYDAATELQSHVRDGMGYEEAREATLPTLRENRRKKNTEDTYWVLGMDPEAADQGLTRELPVTEDHSVFGFTDGFRRLVDTYELFPRWIDALPYLDRTELQLGVDSVRSVEARDPDCSTYPRTKPRDDVTAFHLRITNPDG